MEGRSWWACYVGLECLEFGRARGEDLESEKRVGKDEIGWDIDIACS